MPSHRGESLSLPEVCRILRVGYFTVYGAVLSGRLPAVQDRRRRYWVRREDVARFQKRNAQPGKAGRTNNTAGDAGRRRAEA